MQDHAREVNVRRSEQVEFKALEPPDLAVVPLIAQTFDNQWLPHFLLRRAMKRGHLSRGMETSLKRLVRAEYLRSLINQRQVIINRGFLYNNRSIFQDYLQAGRNREAFKELLDEGTIIPYLYTEVSPLEPPPFEVDAQGFPAWQRLCQEVRMHCLRLSWDDTLNRKIAHVQLARRFHNFAQNIASGDYEQYIQDLDLDVSTREELRSRLLDIARMCLVFLEQEKLVARSDLYKAFITAGENPVERHYDGTKPFTAELKQLLDLAYNTYLADALGGYLLTPADSLLRTALQEWEQLAHLPSIASDDLVRIMQGASFSLAPGGPSLRSVGLLRLQEVQIVRRMDEWRLYVESQEELLKDPLQFTGRTAVNVYQSYLTFVARMTALVQERHPTRTTFTASWIPVIELVIDIAGAVLSVTWTPEGPIYRLSGQISPLVGAAAAPVVARLVIKDLNSEGARVDVTAGIDFIRCKMQYARQQWADIQRQVREIPGFRAWRPPSGGNGPTINYREQTP